MSDDTEPDATTFWEGRYGESDQIWSGNANRALIDVIESLDVRPGRALDLGSGEGGDSIWLAERGWRVTGVDISATALKRAEAHASARGVDVTWVQADLAEWQPPAGFDLVSACFLHSPVAFPREEVLRRAAAAVAPGGHLLVVGHAGFPPWSRHADADADADASAHGIASDAPRASHSNSAAAGIATGATNPPDADPTADHTHAPAPDTDATAHGHGHDDLPTPHEVLDSLHLPVSEWETLIAENRSREATGPDGQHATLDDAILLVRRR